MCTLFYTYHIKLFVHRIIIAVIIIIIIISTIVIVKVGMNC